MKRTKNTFLIVCFIIILIAFCFSFYTFMLGLHNIDMGNNFKYIHAKYNIELIDYYDVNLNSITYHEMINLGYDQINRGVYMMVWFCFVIGLIITEVFE